MATFCAFNVMQELRVAIFSFPTIVRIAQPSSSNRSIATLDRACSIAHVESSNDSATAPRCYSTCGASFCYVWKIKSQAFICEISAENTALCLGAESGIGGDRMPPALTCFVKYLHSFVHQLSFVLYSTFTACLALRLFPTFAPSRWLHCLQITRQFSKVS